MKKSTKTIIAIIFVIAFLGIGILGISMTQLKSSENATDIAQTEPREDIADIIASNNGSMVNSSDIETIQNEIDKHGFTEIYLDGKFEVENVRAGFYDNHLVLTFTYEGTPQEIHAARTDGLENISGVMLPPDVIIVHEGKEQVTNAKGETEAIDDAWYSWESEGYIYHLNLDYYPSEGVTYSLYTVQNLNSLQSLPVLFFSNNRYVNGLPIYDENEVMPHEYNTLRGDCIIDTFEVKINGETKQYQYRKGQTAAEWACSEFNTDDWYVPVFNSVVIVNKDDTYYAFADEHVSPYFEFYPVTQDSYYTGKNPNEPAYSQYRPAFVYCENSASPLSAEGFYLTGKRHEAFSYTNRYFEQSLSGDFNDELYIQIKGITEPVMEQLHIYIVNHTTDDYSKIPQNAVELEVTLKNDVATGYFSLKDNHGIDIHKKVDFLFAYGDEIVYHATYYQLKY